MKSTSLLKLNISILTLMLLIFFSTISAASNSPSLTVYDIATSHLPTFAFGNELIIYDEQIFFSGSDKGLGFELWSLDISTGEISLKQDINIGIGSSSPKGFVIYQDKLYFNAYTRDSGRELWVYDKEDESALLVKDLTDITDERGINASSDPEDLIVFDNVLYFLKKGENAYVRELWYFDGQSNNFAHKDDVSFYTHVDWGGIGNVKMTVFDQRLYIFDNLTSYSNGQDLTAYSLNNTTSSLIEIPVTPLEEMLINDYVQTGNIIYSTYPNGFSSYNIQTQNFTSFHPTFSGENIYPVNLVLSNDNVIFSAYHSDTGYELFSFNLSTLETKLLENIASDVGYSYSRSSYPTEFVQQNSVIYFLINSGDANIANEIWQLDTSTNEVIKKSNEYNEYALTSFPNNKVIFEQSIYFSAKNSDGNAQIWKYDPDTDSVIEVSKFESSLYIDNLITYKERLYFTMSTFVNVDNLWEFNSSDNSFSKITNYENNKPTPIHTLIELNDELYFTVREYQKNIEIWSYKPDSESPIKHTNFSENGENIHGLTKYRNSLYFEYFNNSPDSELWFLYSKNKNFGPVTTLQNQSFNNIDDLTVWGDKLYFTHDNDERLAYYDNYINRFSETDILMPNSFDVYGEYYSDVKIELPYKDYLFFVDKHRFNFGHEPYYLSSGSEEFKLIKDLAPGTCCSDDQSWEGFSWGSNPSSFFAYDDILYFNTSKLSSLFSNYNPSLNQSTLWHMPINEENINNPETINLSSSFDSFREVSDIIAYKGALYATADVIKDSISYGFELIKLDINVTPKVLLNVPEKIAEGKLVYLDASGSLDEDNDELSYIWQQTSGTVVDLHHSDKSIASFVAPQDSEEPLTFKIMVSDGQKQAMDSVSIAVIPNSPPTIELIDPVKTVEEDSTHQFNLSIIDVENDDVSVEWEQVSGTTISITKNDENTVFIGFPEVEGNSIVEVKITANDGNSESSLFFSVEIINHIEKVNPPTVNKSKSGGVFNFYLLILIMFTLSKIRMTNN